MVLVYVGIIVEFTTRRRVSLVASTRDVAQPVVSFQARGDGELDLLKTDERQKEPLHYFPLLQCFFRVDGDRLYPELGTLAGHAGTCNGSCSA